MESSYPDLASIAARHAEWDSQFADLLSCLSQTNDTSTQSEAGQTVPPQPARISAPTNADKRKKRTHATTPTTETDMAPVMMATAHPTARTITSTAAEPPTVGAARPRLDPVLISQPVPTPISRPCSREAGHARQNTSAPSDAHKSASPAELSAGHSHPRRYQFATLKPYPVQETMMAAVRAVLQGLSPRLLPPSPVSSSSSSSSSAAASVTWCRRPVAVVACEVPTGCGKTVSLLSSVLQFLEEMRQRTPAEANACFERALFWTDSRRRGVLPVPAACGPPPALTAAMLATLPTPEMPLSDATDGTAAANGRGAAATATSKRKKIVTPNDGCDGEEWGTPAAFLRAFRVVGNKRLRAEVDPSGSSELRRRFVPPPCTVFYAARTHAQIKQAVRELNKLEGASQHVRMNILGSREHYCVNPTVVRAKGNKTLPVEGNNLGEVCDKLVSLGQCPCVEKYGELACRAIGDGAIGGRSGRVWDLEDLVAEGTVHQACPYYAARDLVFFADINFCAYNYLVDPIIRHECRMEGSIANNCIVVLDEAHNVPAVCQDALSVEVPLSLLVLIQRELAPLAVSAQESHPQQHGLPSSSPSSEAATYLSYPRDFKLTHYTLPELFAFLLATFTTIESFFRDMARDGHNSETASVSGEAFASALQASMNGAAARCQDVMTNAFTASTRGRATTDVTASWTPAQHASAMLKQSYGIVMSLGVTFNPFQLSIFVLSHMKRWLVVLRFLFDRPSAFALSVHVPQDAKGPTGAGTGGGAAAALDADASTSHGGSSEWRAPPLLCAVRCLDGSLAFHHLLRSTYRVILASGTLSPFDQLAKDLGLSPDMWHVVEGQHVVGPEQYLLRALAQLPGPVPSPLQCNYVSMSNRTFVARLAHTVATLASTVLRGGVLVFVPNYHALHDLFTHTQKCLTDRSGGDRAVAQTGVNRQWPSSAIFCEPRKATEMGAVLDAFKHTAQRRPALLFSVYRGKVSEGIDFTDDMARLVLCVGVPLQPLKSWSVVAQRQYSGPDWYTSDAVRAVNQALGRCLRHAGDFGAVVLLECRYEQADYRRRLSRWCRDALVVDTALHRTCEALTDFYARWCREEPASAASRTEQTHARTDKENDVLLFQSAASSSSSPFAPVLAQLPGNQQPRHGHGVPGNQGKTKTSRRPSPEPHSQTPLSTLKQHLWSATAIKLLYEGSTATTDVTSEQFRQQLAALEDTYGDT